MQIKEIYKLDGLLVFGPGAPHYQDFSKSWFEGILELQYCHRDLDEDGLAQAGRLTAIRLLTMSDESCEYSSRVTKLLFDGKPFALHGESGETLETNYLLVTDEALYLAAEAHVRTFVAPPASSPYDVVSEDDSRSLQELFGFYYPSMADAARTRVLEAFGEDAAPILGLEAPARDADYYMLKASRMSGEGSWRTRRQEAVIGYRAEGAPAQYISYGDTVYSCTGALDDEKELKILQSVFDDVPSWWVYRTAEVQPVSDSIVRV